MISFSWLKIIYILQIKQLKKQNRKYKKGYQNGSQYNNKSYKVQIQVMAYKQTVKVMQQIIQFQFGQSMKSKRIADFHISNTLLGHGSFSQVYLGYASDSTKVAVKVIPRSNISNNSIQLFQREINLLNRCKHQNIINLIDVKKTKSNFYIFLELCQEGNLAEYIARSNKLNQTQAMLIFSQLLKAMMAMKRSNIVHRDLKPANIMIKGKNIKVVDFGLATKYSNNQMLKSYSGTPFNMAPEILKGQEYNQKAQIYSAGTILYEMIFGALPFQDRTPLGLVDKIESAYSSKNYLPHQTTQSKLSKPIKQLLIKMLQPNPEKRIDLENVMIQVRKWENSKINERFNSYKRLSTCAIPYMGMMGGIAQMFNFDLNKTKQKSIYDMDLKVCGKLSQKLIINELQWLKNIDLIRV